MSWTKLFSHIVSSSVWNEDDKTRIVWITLLALQEKDHVVKGSVGGVAHQARVSLEDCQKALEKLCSPDADDTSGIDEGRRIRKVEGGWLIVNGEAYQYDDEKRKEYMMLYMRGYRKRKGLRKQSKLNVNKNGPNVNPSPSSSLPHSPSYPSSPSQDKTEEWSAWFQLESENGSSLIDSKQSSQAAHLGEFVDPKPKKKGPLMNAAAMAEFKANPAYAKIDIDREAWKFKTWCETNGKPQSKKRFVNWLNRV
jgi:hypothetical protein